MKKGRNKRLIERILNKRVTHDEFKLGKGNRDGNNTC